MAVTTVALPSRTAAPRAKGLSLEAGWGIIFVIPYVVFFLIFVVWPVLYGLWLGSDPASYRVLFSDPIFNRTAFNTLAFLAFAINLKLFLALLLSGFFAGTRPWIRWLSVIFILPWAVPSIPTIFSFKWMLNSEWGMLNGILWDLFTIEGPWWLVEPQLAFGSVVFVHIWKNLPFWTLILLAGRMAIATDLYEAARIDGATPLQQFTNVTWPHLKNLYITSTLLSTIWSWATSTASTCSPAAARRTHPRAGHARHPLRVQPATGRDRGRLRDGGPADPGAARVPADPPARQGSGGVSAAAAGRLALAGGGLHVARRFGAEAAQVLIGLLVLVWTLLPIYHMVMLSFTPVTDAFAGRYWPDNPTLENYRTVLGQDHFFLQNFWQQLGNSLLVALGTMALVLAVASMATFAITRLRLRFGHWISNAALFTYLIPAAFLAIPFYKVMGEYGLLNTRLALVFAMSTFAIPYAIWVLRQYSQSVPFELDEAAKVDGATPFQIFWMVYIPLLRPALIAIGTYALLLAWNEYLYAFLLLSSEKMHTLPVAMGYFLVTDDSPWPLLMATAIIYALPPAALYYSVRKYMVSGLTAGATKA
jgi:multiple sugar transport system permease protein